MAKKTKPTAPKEKKKVPKRERGDSDGHTESNASFDEIVSALLKVPAKHERGKPKKSTRG